MSELPKVKPFNLPGIFKLKDLLQEAMEAHLGTVVRGPSLRLLSLELQERLPGEIEPDVIYDSIRHLGGTELDWPTIRRESWRLAANTRRLKGNQPAKPWRVHNFREWIPLQLVDSRAIRTKRGRLGSVFTARVLAGTSCTMLLEFFWTMRFCKFMSSSMGYSPPWGKYPFNKMEEYISLRIYVLAEPTDIAEPKKHPEFKHVRVTSSLRVFNQAVVKKRRRVKFRCQFKYKHECHRCRVGYDQCEVATHPRTFVKALCTICDKETWFDPQFIALGMCVNCRTRRDLKNE